MTGFTRHASAVGSSKFTVVYEPLDTILARLHTAEYASSEGVMRLGFVEYQDGLTLNTVRRAVGKKDHLRLAIHSESGAQIFFLVEKMTCKNFDFKLDCNSSESLMCWVNLE